MTEIQSAPQYTTHHVADAIENGLRPDLVFSGFVSGGASQQKGTAPTQLILFTGPTRAVWVALDGDGWDGPSRAHAVLAVLHFMSHTA